MSYTDPDKKKNKKVSPFEHHNLVTWLNKSMLPHNSMAFSLVDNVDVLFYRFFTLPNKTAYYSNTNIKVQNLIEH